jgi:Icc-related predicted phosphoesterase
MKIQPISDIHTEFHKDWGTRFVAEIPVNGDVLVIAGDYTTENLVDQLKGLCRKFKHVVFVPGNHEFWHKGRKSVFAELELTKQLCPNFHWLYNSLVEIEGVRFLGGTMWFDFDPMNQLHEKRWADFRFINGLSTWVYEDNTEFKELLYQHCREGDVVVTHHLPSHLSIHQNYKGSPYNRWFLCDMERFICDREPGTWIHGHTHERFDYKIKNTRIVANPRGYEGFENVQNHRSGFVIEVTPRENA